MELIFAVMICATAPLNYPAGCRLSSSPSIYDSKAGCEYQRDLMNGGYRTTPNSAGILYECWIKEVPTWQPMQR